MLLIVTTFCHLVIYFNNKQLTISFYLYFYQDDELVIFNKVELFTNKSNLDKQQKLTKLPFNLSFHIHLTCFSIN